MGRKLALLIGNGVYDNKKFPPLVKAAADVNALAEVLRAPNIGAFDDVQVLIDESEESIRRTIGRFFSEEKKRDDLLLLYFTGHGDQDKKLRWYLICKDTEPEQLPTTAIPAYVIQPIMDSCNSAQQIVILDSCYSGAFFEGAKGGAEVGTHTTDQLVGRGRVVLTATTATQLAWEGDEPIPTSIFTRYLVQGLKTGEADSDKNGSITVDEWFEYASEQVINETPNQNPTKWVEKQQGSIVVAKNPFLVEQERRRAEEERARIAEEEKERVRLAEEERVKKAEEERRIPEPKDERVLRPPSPGSLPNPLQSTRTPRAQRFWDPQSNLTRPVREFDVSPQRVWTPSTGSIQEEVSERELSPEEKAQEEEESQVWSEISSPANNKRSVQSPRAKAASSRCGIPVP